VNEITINLPLHLKPNHLHICLTRLIHFIKIMSSIFVFKISSLLDESIFPSGYGVHTRNVIGYLLDTDCELHIH